MLTSEILLESDLLALDAADSADRLTELADDAACFLSTPALVALAYADDEMLDAPCLADAETDLACDDSDLDADEADETAPVM